MSTEKLYYENPELFIFIVLSEDDQEEGLCLLEELQETLGLKIKFLINCEHKTRVNKLNHAFQVPGIKMELNMWKEYGNPIRHKVFIKSIKVDKGQLVDDIRAGKIITNNYYECLIY